ncbi:MAG TPA: hypothetical protein DDZ90_11945 [Planctomycetaceae bacterium]|nr:hypothetical protein [Planctomycetaceae bacterium]
MSPDKIRAERSEQEIAAAAFPPEPGFQYPFGTAGQAGPWHTETFDHLACAQSKQTSVCHLIVETISEFIIFVDLNLAE